MKETKYWQQQYKEGKIPQEWLDDSCWETRALLEGNTPFDWPWWGHVLFLVGMLVVAAILALCVSSTWPNAGDGTVIVETEEPYEH